MADTTTIEIAMEDYNTLHKLKERITAIIKNPISLKKTLSIVLSVKSLDQQLSELMLE
jgi:predicted CopG family antitoxin